MRKVIAKPDNDAVNTDADFSNAEDISTAVGWVYCLYHFPTGRLYVGQTIGTLMHRVQQHWWERGRAKDLLHSAISNDTSPFSFILFPLERVNADECVAETRDLARKKFRDFATVRERYWVQRLNTMWPHGWNSAWPGKPAFSRWARPPPTTTLPPGDENTTQQNYEQLVQKYEKSREEVENHLKLMAKADLRAFLDWVALKSTRTAANNAIELYVLELLNQKPPSKKKAFRTLSGWFPSR